MAMLPAISLPKPKRTVAIDYLKSYLVIGMVLAHTVSLLYNNTNSLQGKLMHALVVVINLISFSGFFFCFGYVNYKSYLTKPFAEVKRKIIYNGLRILSAYYISAIASATLLSNFRFEGNRLLHILCFAEMPMYSEFLLSFFLVTIFSLLFFNLLKKAINVDWVLILMIVISLLSSLIIPYQLVNNNQAGLLIGTTKFTGFPVLQYLCYFLLGIIFAKKDVKYIWGILVLALVISCPFFITIVVTHHLPARFPPGISWITGAAFILYLYYIFSLRSELLFGRESSILSIGHNTLLYLILSNIFLFALAARLKGSLLESTSIMCLVYLSIMFIIYYLSKQVAR